MRKLISTVHFTVDPKGITRLIRDIWAEGNYDKAFNILKSMAAGVTIPQELQYEIIRGKKRFDNYNGDRDQFCIVEDKWTPPDGDYYPDPEPAKLAEYLEQKAQRELERQANRRLRGYADPDDEDCEPEPRVEFHGKAIDMSKVKMYAGYGSLAEMNQAFLIKRNLEKIDIAADMHSRDEREGKKPKPDKTLKANSGWLLPNGKYYACLKAMEHVWLASQFGKTEKQAEDAGWIKINQGLLNDINILHFKKPTQKQLDTLFDWCEIHKTKLPDWAINEDE